MSKKNKIRATSEPRVEPKPEPNIIEKLVAKIAPKEKPQEVTKRTGTVHIIPKNPTLKVRLK